MEAVHFTIDPVWFTNFVRSLWAENSYAKAMRMLDAAFPKMALTYKHDIIRGKLKLAQAKDETMKLVKDKWKPNLGACAHSRYPDPDELTQIAEEGMKRKDEYEEMKRVEREATEDLKHMDEEDGEKALSDLNAAYIEKMISDRAGASERAALTLRAMQMKQLGIPSVEEYVDRQHELDSIDRVEADTTLESMNGWVRRDGKFYPCGTMEHIWLAGKLGATEGLAEHDGWVKITTSTMSGVHIFRFKKDPTQKQINTVFDWCERHDHPLPKWAGGKEDV